MSWAELRLTRNADVSVEDFVLFFDWVLTDAEPINTSSTSLTMVGSYGGERLEVTVSGSGFAFEQMNGATYLVAGTIRRLDVEAGGSRLATIKTNLQAEELRPIVERDVSFQDTAAIEKFMFGLDWKFIDSDQSTWLGESYYVNGTQVNLRGDDSFVMRGGNDILFAGNGSDLVDGGSGNDELSGGVGADTLLGGPGNDRLFGGNGPDVLDGGSDADYLYGGAGNDTASYASASAGIVADLEHTGGNTGDAQGDFYDSIENLTGSNKNDNLAGTSGANRIDGGAGKDVLFGRGGPDTLLGRGGKDILKGGSGGDTILGQKGKDTLKGQVGNDTLKGGGGHDIIEGGAGRDLLTGNAGADKFVFRAASDSPDRSGQSDLIDDFKRSHNDKIHLKKMDADTTINGRQSFDFIGKSDFTGTAGELRFERDGGSTLVYGDVDGDATADLAIELTIGFNLKSGDFML